MKHVVTLREAPHKRAICETKMRYDVLLNGEQVGELHYNMTGYRGGASLGWWQTARYWRARHFGFSRRDSSHQQGSPNLTCPPTTPP